MQDRNQRNILIYMVIPIFAVSWIGFGLFIKSEPISAFFTQPFILGLFLSITFVSILIAYSLIKRYHGMATELKELSRFIRGINKGNYVLPKNIKFSTPVMNGINQAICEIAAGQQQQLAELNKRTEQLDEKNLELKDAYIQLESSFGQLQAALELLNDSEKRYHSLVVNIPDIVLTLDNSGDITYASRSCKDILKFRRPEIVGEPFSYIIHSEYSEVFDFQRLKQKIKKDGRQRLHIPIRRKDNSLIQTEVKFTAIIESPGDECIQAIIRDVTEQKRMENALRENNRRLEILNRFSHRLAAMMEPDEIYKTCVNTVTGDLGYFGCIYFMMDKSKRFYEIMNHSGEYFKSPENLKQFKYIHRNTEALSSQDYDGVILDYDRVSRYLIMNRPEVNAADCYAQAYVQELVIGGNAAGMVIVLNKARFIPEELDILRSIGYTTAVAVENAMHLIESKNNFVQTIDALIAAIEAKDQYTRGHSQRVSGLAVKIGEKIGMAKHQVEELRIAGILHDIGKIGISDRILLKKGPLTKEEYEEIKKHPAISNKILYPIGLSDRILKAVAFHHERYDGKGYPFGLTNESLGIEPQIIAVADAFDAMTSSRPYREALSWQSAISELKNNKGSQFHPNIVDIMIQIQMEENEKSSQNMNEERNV